MSIDIRQLRPVEMNIVNDLAHRIWPHTFKEILSQDQLEYMLDWMYDVNTLQEQAQTGHLFFSIEEFGIPKGFIGLEPNFPEEGHLRIHKLYVLPETQGKGFGRILFNQAVDSAFDLDCKKLHLNVNRFNKSWKFYEHLGFKIVREEDLNIGKGYLMEDFVMELDISPSN
jgi:GNAT superfamily N-acetyltransferase